MKSLMEQAREIFNETIKCKNCQYHDECDKVCYRIETLFGVECRTDNESGCIFNDNFKLLPNNEVGDVNEG